MNGAPDFVALEPASQKRDVGPPILSSALVDEADGFEEEVGGDLEGLGAELVDGVLRGVVVAVGELVGVGAVVDVDEVEDGDAAFFEWDVVVTEALDGVLEDVAGVAGVFGGDGEQVFEPRGGLIVLVDVEVLVADHVGQEECFYLGEGAVGVPLGGEMASAVERVGVGPGAGDGFFAVIEDEPDGIALRRMGAEVLAERDEQCGGAGSIVGADEVDVAKPVVGLVVGGEDDHSVFLAGEAGDVVAHSLRAGGGLAVNWSFSKLLLAASGLKWSLMNFSAARCPGEPLKRLGATVR